MNLANYAAAGLNTNRLAGLARLCVAIFACTYCQTNARAAWVIESVYTGGHAGWNLDIDVDHSGQVHAGIRTETGNYLYYLRQGGNWLLQQNFASGHSLELDQLDIPHVLSRGGPPYNLALSTRQSSGVWTNETFALAPVSNGWLAYDSLNHPHIAFVNTAAHELRYASFDGSNWHTVTVANGPGFEYSNPSLVFDLDDADQAHFAWAAGTYSLAYAKPVGDSWQISYVPGAHDATPWDLQVDHAGRVHLAYDLFVQAAHAGGLHYGLFDGTSWATQRISGLEYFGAGETQIVLDAFNNPHLFTMDAAFRGPDLLRHLYWDNSHWAIDPIAQWNSTLNGSETLSVELAADGYHVIYSTDSKNVYHAFLAVPEPTLLNLATIAIVSMLSCKRLRRARVTWAMSRSDRASQLSRI